jgi:hypothetical protein
VIPIRLIELGFRQQLFDPCDRRNGFASTPQMQRSFDVRTTARKHQQQSERAPNNPLQDFINRNCEDGRRKDPRLRSQSCNKGIKVLRRRDNAARHQTGSIALTEITRLHSRNHTASLTMRPAD